MSGDTCLCPASGAKPKLSGFKGGSLGNKYVQLNVGGSLYYTTVRALTRHDTMLKAMFSGRMEVLTDKEGEVSGLVGQGGEGRSYSWGSEFRRRFQPVRCRVQVHFSKLPSTGLCLESLVELQNSLKLYIVCCVFMHFPGRQSILFIHKGLDSHKKHHHSGLAVDRKPARPRDFGVVKTWA